MTGIAEYLESLAMRVANDLIGIYHKVESSSDYGLIFPRKRDGSLRISEQESKLLFVQYLTVDRRLFSVETPTKETYIQKGATGMSARVDLTIYAQDRNPEAHIELKAHNGQLENIRKDVEKLLRERTTGVWFHTLERFGELSSRELMRKFALAFEAVAEHVHSSNKSFLICFVSLESGILTRKWLSLTGDKETNLDLTSRMFGEHSDEGGWKSHNFRPNPAPKSRGSSETKSFQGKGRREGYFVLIPSMNPTSFLHLSVRGGSYKLRDYVGAADQDVVRPFALPKYLSFIELKESELISRWIPVTEIDMTYSLEHEHKYWRGRIKSLNSSVAPETVPRDL